MDAWETARILALVHTAMADCASAMFNDIYHFYHWRPTTAIQEPNDGNGYTVQDPTWKPYKPVPRVPEYPSTFGILGGVTGQILRSIFSNDSNFINNISKAVTDNAISKVFCGWNFRKSALDGIEQGRLIGSYVIENMFRPRSRRRIPNIARTPKPRIL